MCDFFTGWRRKAGCVTLIVACAVSSMWIRSRSIADDIFLTVGDRRLHLRSAYGQFFWGGWPAEGRSHFHQNSDRIEDLEAEGFNWARFGLREMPPNNSVHWAVPGSYLAIPLTLLSAWLLLGKRGQTVATRPY